MPNDESRYEMISRRAFLKRTALLGASLAVPSAVLSACNSDEATLGSTSVSQTAGRSTTAAEATTSTANAEATTTGTASLPDGAELLVDFTYEATSSGGGGAKNPYIAVWVEDGAGDLVATVALWFLQSQKGLRWLDDLRRWATVDGSDSTIDTISSATRAPGAYQVVWDGTTANGERAVQGTYYIAIEAAREHGPYSLIREPITMNGEAFSTVLPSEGELSNAAVSLILA